MDKWQDFIPKVKLQTQPDGTEIDDETGEELSLIHSDAADDPLCVDFVSRPNIQKINITSLSRV